MNKQQLFENLNKSLFTAESFKHMVNEAYILALTYADIQLMDWKKKNVIKYEVRKYIPDETPSHLKEHMINSFTKELLEGIKDEVLTTGSGNFLSQEIYIVRQPVTLQSDSPKYKSVANFFVNAPEEEKQKILTEATKRANQMRRDITNQANQK